MSRSLLIAVAFALLLLALVGAALDLGHGRRPVLLG
jgi:hypothetical protein